MFNTDDPESLWLREQLRPVATRTKQGWSGATVASLLPDTYDCYMKFLHEIEPDYSYLDNPLTLSEERLLRIPACTELVDLLLQIRDGSVPRMTWRVMADFVSLPLSPEFSFEWVSSRLQSGCWPRYIQGPADGALNRAEATRLVHLLRPHTQPLPITCRMAEMSILGSETPLIHTTPLDGMLDLLLQPEYKDLPEYWWPADLSWCVCTDYDLTFTLIGCSRALGSALLDDAILECIEVRPSTRVDWLVPAPPPTAPVA